MASATTVGRRRFDLSVDWRLVGAPGVISLPILDETGANLLDEAGDVLQDEIYYGGTGRARDMHFSKRRFDLTADTRK